MEVCLLDSGDAWLDAGTPDSMLEASHFVQTIQKRQLQQIGCPEEIALKKGKKTKMSNYDLDELERTRDRERFNEALNNIDIPVITINTIEKLAVKEGISLSYFIQTLLPEALEERLLGEHIE